MRNENRNVQELRAMHSRQIQAGAPDGARTAPVPPEQGRQATGPAPGEGAAAPKPAATAADEIDRLNRRLERAIGGFVDDPRRAVREADAVLDETTARLTRLLDEQRHALRESWHGDHGSRSGTEELRVALTGYRDITRQLLRI